VVSSRILISLTAPTSIPPNLTEAPLRNPSVFLKKAFTLNVDENNCSLFPKRKISITSNKLPRKIKIPSLHFQDF